MAELSVDIKANAQQAVSQIKTLGESFEDAGRDMLRIVDTAQKVGKSNDDIARSVSKAFGVPFDEARRSVDRLDDVLKELRRNGVDASGDVEDSFKDLQQQAKRTEDSLEDIGDGGVNNLRKVGETGAEVGQELKQNLGETFSSFRGDLTDLPQIAQDTLGGLASSFGGLPGIIAAAAGAAGIGLLIGAFDQANEATKRNQEQVAEWASAYVDAGSTVLSAGVQAARFQEIITDPEKFKEAETNATNWGVAIETAISAMAGNQGAIDDITISLEGQRDAAAQAAQKAQELSQAAGGQLGTLTLQEQAYNAGAAALESLTGQMEQGAQRAQILNGYYADLINTTAGATVQVDDLGNSLYTLPDETQIFVDAKTGQASQNISNFKGDLSTIEGRVVTSTVRLTVDDSAWRNYVPGLKVAPIQVNPVGPRIAWEG